MRIYFLLHALNKRNEGTDFNYIHVLVIAWIIHYSSAKVSLFIAVRQSHDSVQVSFHINTTHGRLKTYLMSNNTLKAHTQKRHLIVLVEATCPDYFLQFDKVFKLGIIIIRQF